MTPMTQISKKHKLYKTKLRFVLLIKLKDKLPISFPNSYLEPRLDARQPHP